MTKENIMSKNTINSKQVESLERTYHKLGVIDELPPPFKHLVTLDSWQGPRNREELALKERFDRLEKAIRRHLGA